MKHTLKIESLEIKIETANEIVETICEFLVELGFSEDRISKLECRSRDGFMSYGHNMGGLGAVAYDSQHGVYGNGGTGFENSDTTLEKYAKYDSENFEKSIGVKEAEWTEENREQFYDSQNEDQESDVLYSLDAMLTSETELNLRICICVKDAPYHRKYDDLISIDLGFKTIAGLKKKLASILKRKDVKKFGGLLSDTY